MNIYILFTFSIGDGNYGVNFASLKRSSHYVSIVELIDFKFRRKFNAEI